MLTCERFQTVLVQKPYIPENFVNVVERLMSLLISTLQICQD